MPHAFFFGVIDDASHQWQAESATLEPRADQNREFRGLFIELVVQANEPEHVTRVFVERDEGYGVPIIEMAERIEFRGAELGNARKKPKPQILGVDMG